MMTILSSSDLKWSYDGNIEILKGITISAKKGITCIIGPNGSGKTTLIKCLGNINTNRTGTVFLNDKDIKDYKRRALGRIMSYVPQEKTTIYGYSLYEIVEMGRYPHINRYGLMSAEDRKEVQNAMELLNIWHLKSKPVTEVSGGEAQRTMIARALAQKPKVLLMDEPTNHLDIKHQQEILKLLKSLNDITVVIVLHDINQVLDISDTVIVLKDGRLHTAGETRSVLDAKLIKEVFDIDADILCLENSNKRFMVPRSDSTVVF